VAQLVRRMRPAWSADFQDCPSHLHLSEIHYQTDEISSGLQEKLLLIGARVASGFPS
jgi:hypothetical protein